MCKQTNSCSVINWKNGKRNKTGGHKTAFINYHYNIPPGQEVVRFFSFLQLRAAAVSRSLSTILFYCNNNVPRRNLIRGNNSITRARSADSQSMDQPYIRYAARIQVPAAIYKMYAADMVLETWAYYYYDCCYVHRRVPTKIFLSCYLLSLIDVCHENRMNGSAGKKKADE